MPAPLIRILQSRPFVIAVLALAGITSFDSGASTADIAAAASAAATATDAATTRC
ncbi:hypothetical protein [Algiphilus sp.]|uniref:hypothetical protein n=1 Tax=Algiphilus sp. TaxID=1872431 RepID=UPI0025BE5CE5|nr:hypothetical protein [Algiphilus sp.]MCK5769658.1 hypothetical protein [Algiphilus sp.]